ncbi:MAG: T9SS type A sorting domain-containing protein [Schleiferiaceae bacterium]|nr:T9SS type A sorting domain-containing protein [Schleiferiaceae bacterium]
MRLRLIAFAIFSAIRIHAQHPFVGNYPVFAYDSATKSWSDKSTLLKKYARINIYTLNGQLVRSIQGNIGENHVEKLTSGGYLVRISTPTDLSSSILIAL